MDATATDINISVIIPVYGVEPFIGRCVSSLMDQTLAAGVEFIFVDDATPDSSIDIIRSIVHRYPARRNQVRIIRHPSNRGLPAARNTGLSVARGRYIYHCDSDDFLEPDALQALLNAAEASGADAVWCDWFLTFARSRRRMHMPPATTPDAAVRAMLSGGMKYNVWNKLLSRQLYNRAAIQFPPSDGMGEDLTIVCLMACARKVAHVPHPLYNYVKTNTAAFSQSYSELHLQQLRRNVDRTIRFFNTRFSGLYTRELQFLCLEAKFPFLLMSPSAIWFQRWRAWYPDANTLIAGNSHISPRNRRLQLWAAAGHRRLVAAYAFLFNLINRIRNK